MRKLIFLLLSFAFVRAAYAQFAPAASVGYVRDAINATGVCRLRNNAPDGVAANMEYLMRAIDICNRGVTGYGKSEYATNEMANTDAVQKMTDALYVTDGLLVALDADNMDDWIIGDTGSLERLSDGLQLSRQYLRTKDMFDLSLYQNVTVEIRFRLSDPLHKFHFEHSSNWNSEPCGFGFALNIWTGDYNPDMIHTYAGNGGWVNHEIKTTDLISHTVVKTFTSIDSAHHLTFYDGAELMEPVYQNRELFCSPLRNDFFYVGCRPANENCTDEYGAIVHSVRIYNRALTAGEVCHNAWVDYRRFGGARPDCVM